MLSPVRPRWLRIAAPLVASVALGACSEAEPTAPFDAVASFDHIPGEPAELHIFEVCKVGTAASFEVVITPVIGGANGTPGTPGAPFQVSLQAGDCATVANSPTSTLDVSVTELETPGTTLTSILKESFVLPARPKPADETITGTPTVTGRINGDLGVRATFFNEIRPPGTDGCTPGFWKQSQHFAFWTAPFTTGTLLDSPTTFVVPGDYTGDGGAWLGNFTLLEGLNFNGGSQLSGAARNLLRAAVAALLNAANPNVNYPMTTGEVVAAVNAALASHDRATMLSVKDELDRFNNLGCTAKP